MKGVLNVYMLMMKFVRAFNLQKRYVIFELPLVPRGAIASQSKHNLMLCLGTQDGRAIVLRISKTLQCAITIDDVVMSYRYTGEVDVSGLY